MILLLLLLLSSAACAEDWLSCEPWKESKHSFALQAELEESGATYLDAFVDLQVYENDTLVFSKNRIDTTGFYSLTSIYGQQVYLAELRALDQTFTSLVIAANHPRPSGNTILVFNGKEYLAECSVR